MEHSGDASRQEALSQIDFREICENLYDGIHVTDGTGTIIFINQAYTRTTGIKPEDLLGGPSPTPCWPSAGGSTPWPPSSP